MRVAALLLGLAIGCAGSRGFDPVVGDPQLDAAHPARTHQVVFASAGARMFGVLYEAGGPGPHPTAIVLHGFPGDERNLDLAQAIRRSGWNAVFFHYRGAWGSEGRFGFVHVLEDVRAVVDGLSAPEFAAAHRVDPRRIALVGHSMGGFAALLSAAELSDVDCVASLAGANLGLWDPALASPEAAAQIAGRLDAWRGPIQTPGRELTAEVREHAARFDIRRHAATLAGKPTLLIAGARDEVTPPALHHEPLVAAIAAESGASLESHVLDADHAFADRRVELTRLVVGWLAGRCTEPGRAG
ncbi:MAG: alpha/beta fold hydrolase [Myxococcota bacterium]